MESLCCTLTSFSDCTGIEEIGVQIEEPFSILALGAFTIPREWSVLFIHKYFGARHAVHGCCEYVMHVQTRQAEMLRAPGRGDMRNRKA
jgi:hypothetical protein